MHLRQGECCERLQTKWFLQGWGSKKKQLTVKLVFCHDNMPSSTLEPLQLVFNMGSTTPRESAEGLQKGREVVVSSDLLLMFNISICIHYFYILYLNVFTWTLFSNAWRPLQRWCWQLNSLFLHFLAAPPSGVPPRLSSYVFFLLYFCKRHVWMYTSGNRRSIKGPLSNMWNTNASPHVLLGSKLSPSLTIFLVFFHLWVRWAFLPRWQCGLGWVLTSLLR